MSTLVKIIGYLSAFAALGIALFIVAGAANLANQTALASNIVFWANVVIAIVVIGALLGIAKRLGVV